MTDGLVLHYDAIDNTGSGHDSSATTWTELSGKGTDFTLPSGAVWGDDFISFPKVAKTCAVLGSDFTDTTQTNFTFEYVVRLDPTETMNLNSTGARDVINTRRCILWYRRPGFLKSLGYGAVGSNTHTGTGNAMYWMGFNECLADLHTLDSLRHFHTFAIREVTASYGAKFTFNVDGGLYYSQGAKVAEAGSQALNSNLTLGNANCKIQIRAIRVYNRHLTEAEIAQNAAEDASRWPTATDAERPSDPFADARWCFRGAKAASDVPAGYTNVVSALYAGGSPGAPDNGATPADRQFSIYGTKTNCMIRTMDVTCPFAGRTLKNRKVMDFQQSVYENASGVKRCTPCLLRAYASGCYTNKSQTTIVARFRIDDYDTTEHGSDFYLMSIGYGWSAESGTALRFLETSGDDNFYVQAYHGSNADKFTNMTNILTTSDYRISKGKWIDLALTVNGRANNLYYQVEDGKFYSGAQNADVATKESRSQALVLGSSTVPSNGSVSEQNASAVTYFRGQIQQLAVWDRALSLDEVKACFRDGCDDADDALRIGVPNANRAEFAGTATTIDAGDQDAWLSMTNALDKAGDSLTVNFDLPTAHVLIARTFRFSAAVGASVGASVEVKLNGCLVDDALTVEADKTVSVAVPPTLFKAKGNVLTIKRTDSLSGTVGIDALALTAGGDAQTVSPTGVRNGYDVYSDAYCWYKGFEDENGDGYFFPDSSTTALQIGDMRDALRIADRTSSAHAWNVMSYVSGSYFQHAKMSVALPAAGKTLSDESCLHICSKVDNTTGIPKATWGGLSHKIFAVTNATGYSALARIRLDGYMLAESNEAAQVFGTGYSWSNKRGCCLKLMGEPDNMYVHIEAGYSGLEYKDTQNGAAKNRLAQGKWMDIGYTVSNCWIRVYTCVEGGDIVEQLQDGGWGASGTPAASSTAYVGSTAGGGASKGIAASDFTGFDGYFHQFAIWPRQLSAEEMALAMKWPEPDVFHVGTVNGSDQEFYGDDQPFEATANGAFRTASTLIAPGGSYEVKFACDESKIENQRLVVGLTSASSAAQFKVEINGERVMNYAKVDRSKIKFLTVPAGGWSEFGIRKNLLKAGSNTLKLTRVDESDENVILDGILLGNQGEHVRVYCNAGLSLILQ